MVTFKEKNEEKNVENRKHVKKLLLAHVMNISTRVFTDIFIGRQKKILYTETKSLLRSYSKLVSLRSICDCEHILCKHNNKKKSFKKRRTLIVMNFCLEFDKIFCIQQILQHFYFIYFFFVFVFMFQVKQIQIHRHCVILCSY